jgi:predicted amino acid-binding ACT domain protein
MATLTEEKIRAIALAAVKELGGRATPGLVRRVVDDVVEKLENGDERESSSRGWIAFVSACGYHHPDVVSGLTTAIGQCGCTIQDLLQRVSKDLFILIAVVEAINSDITLHELRQRLAEIAGKYGVRILVQSADMFK